MSLSRRKFMKAGFVAACVALPLKSVLAQSGQLSSAQSSLPSSSKINPDQLGYYTESSFTPYVDTQFNVYLSPSSTRAMKLIEVNDYLSTLPRSVAKGNPRASQCFSLLMTTPQGNGFDQDTYLIEHDALGSFYMFVVPVGQRGKSGLDYYEAVFYRRQENLAQNNTDSLVGTSVAATRGLSVREAEVFYFRPQAIKSSAASVQTEEPGAAGRRAAAKLSMSQFPDIDGLRLGMTVEQVLALFPGSKDDAEVRADLSKPPTQFGEQSLVIRPGKFSPKKRLDGLSQIVITFLDGRAYFFYLGFDAPAWEHVDKFVTKFSYETKLPGAQSWNAYVGLDTQLKTLRCRDFEISLFAGGNNVNISYVQLRDLVAEQKLEERMARAQAKEGAKP